MNIGILTSNDPQLRQQLAAGLSPDATAAPADREAAAEVAVAKPRPTFNTAPSVPFPSLRAALDARIAADMSSGQISTEDAATVGTILDAIDERSSGSASTAEFLAGRAISAGPNQIARAYLATIDRGTLIDRWA